MAWALNSLFYSTIKPWKSKTIDSFRMTPPRCLIEEFAYRQLWEVVSCIEQELRNLNRPLPHSLYHYTDISGFKGIIESGIMRATHLGFLNDANEYKYAISVFRNALSQYIKEHPQHPEEESWYAFLELLDPDEVSFNDYPPIFVACFSVAQNDLSQWRAYGQGEGGIAIGFDPEKLKAEQRNRLIPVEYSENRQKAIANKLMEVTTRLYAEHVASHRHEQEDYRKRWYQMWRIAVATIPHYLKEQSFSEEREWRVWRDATSPDDIEFRAKARTLVPYIKLQIGQQRSGEMPDKLPITDVWVGPGRDNELSLYAAEGLLQKYGYGEVKVHRSMIPYRVA